MTFVHFSHVLPLVIKCQRYTNPLSRARSIEVCLGEDNQENAIGWTTAWKPARNVGNLLDCRLKIIPDRETSDAFPLATA